MFNPILDGLPNYLLLSNEKVNINTDFKLFLKFIKGIKTDDKDLVLDTLSKIFNDVNLSIYDPDEVSNKLSEFMQLGDKKVDSQIKQSPTFDFFFDADVIYADFKRSDIYNLDLSKVDMHWIDFKMMVNNLPDYSATEKRKSLRNLKMKDVAKENRSKLRAIQKSIAIPNQITAEQEEALLIFNKMKGK